MAHLECMGITGLMVHPDPHLGTRCGAPPKARSWAAQGHPAAQVAGVLVLRRSQAAGTGPRNARRRFKQRFERLFTTRTGFATLDRLLTRLHANGAELLVALERPDIPLHINGSENDIRYQVIKRKISGGTRSDAGHDCRDVFLGLMKTCAKLEIPFWDYLGDRLKVPDVPAVPDLPDLISQRAALA